MDAQPLPLPPEISQALAANGGSLLFEDRETLEVYRLAKETVEVTLDEEYIREGLARAQAEFDAGRVEPWDIESTIAEAKRRHEMRQRQ